jgi:hypothetical protein
LALDRGSIAEPTLPAFKNTSAGFPVSLKTDRGYHLRAAAADDEIVCFVPPAVWQSATLGLGKAQGRRRPMPINAQ